MSTIEWHFGRYTRLNDNGRYDFREKAFIIDAGRQFRESYDLSGVVV